MPASPPPRRTGSTRLNARLLALAIGVACVLSMLMLLDPIETGIRVLRDKIRSHPASGSVVVVALDDRSLAEIGEAPWPHAAVATMLTRLTAAGARRVEIDLDLSAGRSAGDASLPVAMRAAQGRVILPARFAVDHVTGQPSYMRPPASLARFATIANTNIWVQRGGNVWYMPYAVSSQGAVLPSLAALLGGVAGQPGDLYPIDYAIDLRSIPVISAADIVAGRWRPADVAGKDVLIGQTSSASQRYFAPGYGLAPGIFVHAVAIETLRGGRPVALGWPWTIAFAALVAGLFLFARHRAAARTVLAAGALMLLIVPIVLERFHIFTAITPGLSLLAIVAGARLWTNFRRSYQARGTTNPISGLPNLQALRQAAIVSTNTVVMARILNFAEALTALPPDSERDMVNQIVKRLGFGAGGATIYHSDDGIFLWLDDGSDTEGLSDQLGALHALFRSPVIVADRLVDLSISFGLDNDRSRTVMQRVSSALVAADRAASEGQRWMTYDPAALEDAEWRMSLLARLDQAIDNGEIWLAYQPKIALDTGRIVGVEALARWTHPDKGDIPPIQFIAAAERSGRIDRLTAHVLDTAVATAAMINRTYRGFSVAVNLSPRLLDRPDLAAMVEEVLARHRLPGHLLCLEVTETMAMVDQEKALLNLKSLSALGVQLSIDDYGTGFSTLEYLRMIPAGEIKIDRSFISMLEKSQSDRIMVHSTIQLAHSLGRKVVAEGVETAATLNELKLMQCDYVQGYFTGRPNPLPVLVDLLRNRRMEQAA
ncbi:EAL domain-containing protein [Sphingomonas profundi]|uniref:EAL domain-containing protein n=1 Tax=Alterirhizorhabdus profundi TaxID=2681549 RepID=UPI0012E889B4|nr:EAL domain-containing protein [Sphingomonas profundi]